MNTASEKKISLWNTGLEKSPGQKLAIFLLLTGVCMILGNFASLIPLYLSGKSLHDMAQLMSDSRNARLIQILQIIGTFFIFFLPSVLFLWIAKPGKELYLNVHSKTALRQWIMVVSMAFAGLFVTDLLGWVNELIPISSGLRRYFMQMEHRYDAQVQAMVRLNTFGDFFFSLFMVALLPAVFEEVFFRGVLQGIFVEMCKKPWIGILITSILFSAIHVSYFGFLPRLFLGAALGMVYYYGRNLYLNILFHFINNATAVVGMFWANHQHKPIMPQVNQHENIFLLLICTGLFVISAKRFLQYCYPLPNSEKSI